jgi:serine/threonine-protein kinase
MGVVYLGRHEVLGRLSALKTALPTHANDAHLRRRMLAEAKAQSRLLHPNVVALYEPIDDNGELFIAMEYVEGETLADRLHRSPGSRLTIDHALPLFEQLLDALAFVHSEKIVHRDVKPSNVMVSNTDRVKLSDFGLALLAGEPRLTAFGIPGTPQYMSPEQLQGKDLDHRSDIYSSALVLYRMLSGRAAFQSTEYLAQLHERMSGPPPLRTLVADLPASVCEAVVIALQVEPGRRFESASSFREELRRAVSGFFPSPPPSPADEITVPDAVPVEPLSPVGEHERRTVWKVVTWAAMVASAITAMGMVVPYLGSRWPSATQITRAGTLPPVRPTKPGMPPPVSEATVGEQKRQPEPRREPLHESPPKPAPRLEPSQQESDWAALAVKRRNEIEALREEIRNGLKRVEDDLRNENFIAASEELERLDRKAREEPELSPEREAIADLRRRIGEAQVAASIRGQQELLWGSRLQDIENEIDHGRFPEAIGIAENVKKNPLAPSDVAARADELLRKAKKALADTFRNTDVGTTTNSIRKPSSPPRKDD